MQLNGILSEENGRKAITRKLCSQPHDHVGKSLFALIFTSADQDPKGQQYLLKYIKEMQNNLFRQQDIKYSPQCIMISCIRIQSTINVWKNGAGCLGSTHLRYCIELLLLENRPSSEYFLAKVQAASPAICLFLYFGCFLLEQI